LEVVGIGHPDVMKCASKVLGRAGE
jgi:hypothetical protein